MPANLDLCARTPSFLRSRPVRVASYPIDEAKPQRFGPGCDSKLTWRVPPAAVTSTTYEPAENTSRRRRRRPAGSVRNDAEVFRVSTGFHQQFRSLRSAAARRDRRVPVDRSPDRRHRNLLHAPRMGDPGGPDRSVHPAPAAAPAVRRRVAGDERAASFDLSSPTADAERAPPVLIYLPPFENCSDCRTRPKVFR